MMISTDINDLVVQHLISFPQDVNYVNLLLKNEEFAARDKAYLSWLKFNLRSVQRGNELVRKLENEIGYIKGFKVLDIGAGGGGHSIAFSQHSCQVTAIEIDAVRLAWLRTRVSDWHMPIQIYDQPLEMLTLSENYDMILCIDVIEHAMNWKKLMERILHLNSACIYLSWPNKHAVLNMVSDPHYGLSFAIFMTGRLQLAYLNLRRQKRNAWVSYIPSVNELKMKISQYGSFNIKQLPPTSINKISEPNKINSKKIRLIVKGLSKIGISPTKLRQYVLSQVPTNEILCRKIECQ